MHYQHAYHAGNFADVHKHVVLIALLEALLRKDKPLCYLDTHAGAGRYDLASSATQATGEAAEGALLLESARALPPLLARWQALVAAFNEGGAWRRYPGSPAIAQALLRANDRLLLCETVPVVADELRLAMHRGIVHQRDGYEAVSLLPPPEKRGLVLVDPPFERRDEFTAMEAFLAKAQARFAGGVYACWYPLKNTHEADRFCRRVAQQSPKPVLDCRFDTGAKAEGQMRGSGVLVVNPPYQIDTALQAALDTLAAILAQGRHAIATLSWLKTE
jgi:23S rRNA (adenine2030-N6)-methyltransferase